MSEPTAATSGSNLRWIVLGLVLMAGLVAVIVLLGPSGGGEEADPADGPHAAQERLQGQGPYRLSAGPATRALPSDSEVVVFAKMHQVLRSPILPALKLDRTKLWERMKFDPRVKTFLETSGLKLDQSKHFSLIVRGLGDPKRAPHVVAQWEGTFDSQKVTQSFREALKANEVEIAGQKVLGDGAIALHAAKGLVLGNRPLFDDLLKGKGDFTANKEVKDVMAHLGKQGAITAFVHVVAPPKVKIPMVPAEKVKWLGATLEVMGSPKIRLVALTNSKGDAEELAAGIESALGIGSLALSAKGGAEAIVDLIETMKIDTKEKVVTISLDVPLSKLPDLVGSVRNLR